MTPSFPTRRSADRFAEPQKLVDALSGRISPAAIRRLVDKPQMINESFRCFPGQRTHCGILPPGQEGVIVDPERFVVELFFRSEEHTSELQSLMRRSFAVIRLKKNKKSPTTT